MVTPLVLLADEGCLLPGGRLTVDGDGVVCEGFVPLRPVCTNGGGGRFTFGAWGAGLTGAAVAIWALWTDLNKSGDDTTLQLLRQ